MGDRKTIAETGRELRESMDELGAIMLRQAGLDIRSALVSIADICAPMHDDARARVAFEQRKAPVARPGVDYGAMVKHDENGLELVCLPPDDYSSLIADLRSAQITAADRNHNGKLLGESFDANRKLRARISELEAEVEHIDTGLHGLFVPIIDGVADAQGQDKSETTHDLGNKVAVVIRERDHYLAEAEKLALHLRKTVKHRDEARTELAEKDRVNTNLSAELIAARAVAKELRAM